jgi:hypothetical protein
MELKEIEEKAKAYDEASKWMEGIYPTLTHEQQMEAEAFFSELKESEDERIRKELICFLETEIPHCNARDKYIAWLEKQGKQKETLCDKCKKAQPSHSCQDITALGRCALENQGVQKQDPCEHCKMTYSTCYSFPCDEKKAFEQDKTALEAINEEKVDNANKVEPRQEKLTKFEKAVKQVMEEAIECGDTHNLKADAEMLLSLVHKSAWSEDDELHIRELESLVKQVWTTAEHENDKDTIHKMSDLSFFLKTLKPQPKQEWSEEEQDIIEDAVCVILDCINTAETEKEKKRLEELFDKIQDLKPQSTWKPSDEQIKAVKEAACYSSVFSEKTIDNLIFLSKDLKKLKE